MNTVHLWDILFCIIAILAISYCLFYGISVLKTHKSRIPFRMSGVTLNGEALDAFAKSIAITTQYHTADTSYRVWHMVKSDGELIATIYNAISKRDSQGLKIPEESRWILDNYYVVEKQLRAFFQEFDKKLYRKLPPIEAGNFAGYPRAYYLATQLVGHSDSVITEEKMQSFLQAYQQNGYLKCCEIRLFSIMIKAALLENVAYILWQAHKKIRDYSAAEEIYEFLKQEKKRSVSQHKLDGMLADDCEINATFLQHLIFLLQQHPVENWDACAYIESKMEARGLSIDWLLNKALAQETACRLTMGNAMQTMMNGLCGNGENVFFAVSHVVAVLNQDAIYQKMSSQSRMYYVYAVEDIAKKAHSSEEKVARLAMELSQTEPMNSHVGYYLIDEGQAKLWEALGKKHKKWFWKKEACFGKYLISFCAVTLLICGFISGGAYSLFHRAPLAIVLFFLGLIPISQGALELVNGFFMRYYKKREVMSLDIKTPIEDHTAVLSVITALVVEKKDVDDLCDKMERYFLSNYEKNICFGILTDGKDSGQSDAEKEAELAQYAQEKIELLNKKYANNVFYYFHREKRYNESEKRFMGYERKRGALVELVRLLYGENTSISFTNYDGKKFAYINTIDSDTVLYQATVKKLWCAMRHPLNHPVLGKQGIVIRGYGLMLPRIDTDLEDTTRTLFAHIWCGCGGLSSYAAFASDFYYNVFSESIYTGKGLFCVKTFYETLDHTFIPNRILSHDLLEGSFLRCAFVSDAGVCDGFPTRYDAYAKRQNRWIRGDIQALHWAWPYVQKEKGCAKNPLKALSRFKIIDNVRRAMVAPFYIVTILYSLCFLQGHFLLWITLLTFGIDFVRQIIGIMKSKNIYASLQNAGRSLVTTMARIMLSAADAVVSIKATMTSVWRMHVSRRGLLEWTTANEDRHAKTKGAAYYYHFMAGSVIIGAFLFLIALSGPFFMKIIGGILGTLYLGAPAIMAWLSKESKKHTALSHADILYIRRIAFLTFQYYNDFVDKTHHFLAPDNIQFSPQMMISERTSPTNIGIQILAYVAGRDFGYSTTSDMVTRLENLLDTIDQLPTFRTQLYNWYDTKTLEKLNPAFVSTVDNGNYIGFLITARQAVLQYADLPLIDKSLLSGLCDAILWWKDGRAIAMGDNDLFALNSQQDVTQQAIKEALFHINWPKERKEDLPLQLVKKMTNQFIKECNQTEKEIADLRQRMLDIADRMEQIIQKTDFSFLYDEKKDLLSVGYDTVSQSLSTSDYDLLCSEARLSSIIAISHRFVPEKHWFCLGRTMVHHGGKNGMVSWTGTMFEYLMPYLILKSPKNSLLYNSYHFALDRQIDYAKDKKIPWGISESGYYAFDRELHYQYKAFGVPYIALKRESEKELVVAPYATLMALMIDVKKAIANLKRLESYGIMGPYGPYEAIDFTKYGYDLHSQYHRIQSYMVHHLGMGFLAMDNVLFCRVMQERFHKDATIGSVDYLLGERFSVNEITKKKLKEEKIFKKPPLPQNVVQVSQKVSVDFPRMYALSNGKGTVIIDELGHGYYQIGERQMTRYRVDIPRKYGWEFSIGIQGTWHDLADMTQKEAQVSFTNGVMEYRRSLPQCSTTMRVCVAPEKAVEMRWVTLTNRTENSVEITLQSLCELTMVSAKDDMAHPAFSNLFITTDFQKDDAVLWAKRKPRSDTGDTIYGFCKVLFPSSFAMSCQTDRLFFERQERKMYGALHGQIGAVLDPIFATRLIGKLAPLETLEFGYMQGMAHSKEAIEEIIQTYTALDAFKKCFAIWKEQYPMQQRYLQVTAEEETEFWQIMPFLYAIPPTDEKRTFAVQNNTLCQRDLWKMGISGEKPIVCIRIGKEQEIWFAQKMLRCFHFYRAKNVFYDFVILIQEHDEYMAPIFHRIQRYMDNMMLPAEDKKDVFLLTVSHLAPEDMVLLEKTAVLFLSAQYDLTKRMADLPEWEVLAPKTLCLPHHAGQTIFSDDLDFYNGYGGFSKDKNAYILRMHQKETTPLPWSHILANEGFGTVLTQDGGGYTYAGNSRENKLTPWSNDAAHNWIGERIYYKDLDDADVTSAVQGICTDDGIYEVEYGMGYGVYRHEKRDIVYEQRVLVAPDAPIKLQKIILTNHRKSTAHLSITYYIKPVMGVGLSATERYLYTRYQEKTLAVQNAYNGDFKGHISFITTSLSAVSYTTDDRYRKYSQDGIPLLVCLDGLDNALVCGQSCCLALKSDLEILPQNQVEFVLAFGETKEDKMLELSKKYQNLASFDRAWEQTLQEYQNWLSVIQVQTGDRATDHLLNGFVLYQAYNCRLLARSAFYQAGGAFGFRDQLQDVLCLLEAKPQKARSQILKHAAHQFLEGDVLHWWHEVDDGNAPIRGVRTRFSDDRLWLCYVGLIYVNVTGDEQILKEKVPYLEADLLSPGEDEKYLTPHQSNVQESLYEHMMRAMEIAMDCGEHGLLKMGSGDWNDGMNTVGNEGKGESVWLSFFWRMIAQLLLPFMKEYKDDRYITIEEMAQQLEENIDRYAWDGKWYKRAFFDDGSPLGSFQNQEGKIDSIAQSFSVLSQTGSDEKQRMAMESAYHYLVDHEQNYIRLLWPPFTGRAEKPGYIAGYLPGVRENGGQYTHAAVWFCAALAKLGQRDKAWECYQMLNPIYHSDSKEKADRYKTEPYALAADVYDNPQHKGRGGWSLYTGAASWYYYVGIHYLLGINKCGQQLSIHPQLGKNIEKVSIQYRFLDTVYDIMIHNPKGVYEKEEMIADGEKTAYITLCNDKKRHQVTVNLF